MLQNQFQIFQYERKGFSGTGRGLIYFEIFQVKQRYYFEEEVNVAGIIKKKNFTQRFIHRIRDGIFLLSLHFYYNVL